LPAHPPPPARLLDLTRSVSRAGRGPATGIDRVERAYLHRLLATDTPLFGLVRSALGFVLLDRAGVVALAGLLAAGGPWDEPGPLARLAGRRDPHRARVEATARRLALARMPRPGLGRMLHRHLPEGAAWLNLGHANLTRRTLAGLRAVPGARVTAMLHDTIPLDHPELCRPGTTERFARLFTAALGADLLVVPSHATAEAVARHAGAAAVPPIVVAPLGLGPAPPPDPGALPPGLPGPGPYVLALGTIEPRKNLGLLLEAWAALPGLLGADAVPRLIVVGARGWADAAFLARLEAACAGGRVVEAGALPDAAVAALLEGAAALAFPSRAEGFGLPPLEAARAGVPVLCAQLPVYRETLGDWPVYLPHDDGYPWAQAVAGIVRAGKVRHTPPPLPDWDAHFRAVLSRT